MTNMIDNGAQLELGLNGVKRTRLGRREHRMARAAWWFGKMREAVNGTMDWSSAPARPEQTFLPGAYRQVRV